MRFSGAGSSFRKVMIQCGRGSCTGWTKETSGILLVAKNDFAHAKLSEAFRSADPENLHNFGAGNPGRSARAHSPRSRAILTGVRMTATRACRCAYRVQQGPYWRVVTKIDSTSLLELHLTWGDVTLCVPRCAIRL